MTTIRRRLRLFVAAWLVIQAASLSALVPRECCAAHRQAHDAEPGCHEKAAPARCPMPAADGTPCPMHRTKDTAQRSDDTCSMRGTCDGPVAALLAQLSNYGLVTDSFELLPDLHVTSARIHPREHLTGRLAPPDPPPPRG